MLLRLFPGLVLMLALAPAVRADDAAKAADEYARGQALLKASDFNGALAAYTAAVKADPANETYRHEHALLRRVVPLRAKLLKQRDAEKWQALAAALRSYYADHGLLEEVLRLDEEAYARSGDADTAAMLADTQIRMGRDAAAVETLGGLKADEQTAQTRTQMGIALAHAGRTDEARAIASGLADDKAGPGLLYDMARLNSLVADNAKALAQLTRCFELTRPSRLAAFKEYTKADQDLSGLVAQADFAKVLATDSKLKESDCSGGTSCAKCPSRAKCAGSSGAKTAAKDTK